MGCGRVLAGLLAVNVVILAVLLHSSVLNGTLTKPLPPELPNQGTTRFFLVVLDAITTASQLLSKLGFGTESEARRKVMDSLVFPPDYTGLKVVNTVFEGVKVRVYEPEEFIKNRPGIMLYHGGGWHWGSINTHDMIARSLAKEVGAVVASVDYRLAPEYPYPTPLEDCEVATKYFLTNAHKFGVDSTRIALAGDSAGGNLAAAISLKLRDTKFSIQPKIQVLVYPVLQGVDLYLPSHIKNHGVVYGSREGMAEAMVFYGRIRKKLLHVIVANNHTSLADKEKYRNLLNLSLLPPEFTKDVEIPPLHDGDFKIRNKLNQFFTDPYAFPLMEENLEGLPQAYIITVEYDLLRDEGALYAEKLKRAGNRATWNHVRDGFHGIWNCVEFPLDIKSGRRLMNDLVQYLQKNL